MGHYRSEMMSDYQIDYENWKSERLRTMRDALSTKTTNDLPLKLLGPVLRILGELTQYMSGTCNPSESDIVNVANHFGITLKPPPKK